MTPYVQLSLVCADKAEADRIGRTLLKSRLIGGARLVPVTSQLWLRGEHKSKDEILLVMETAGALFDQIEDAITQLHGSETIMLVATPLVKVSTTVARWMDENLWQEGLRDI